jgi:predicted DNA-binding transcriptional regulator AlpA
VVAATGRGDGIDALDGRRDSTPHAGAQTPAGLGVALTTAVWARPLPPIEKLTLLALAQLADAGGHAGPPEATLIRMTGLPGPQLRRALDALLARGALEVAGRGAYRLALALPPPCRPDPAGDRLCVEEERRTITGASTAEWYRLQRAGLAPRPVPYGRRVAWRMRDLQTWLAAAATPVAMARSASRRSRLRVAAAEAAAR